MAVGPRYHQQSFNSPASYSSTASDDSLMATLLSLPSLTGEIEGGFSVPSPSHTHSRSQSTTYGNTSHTLLDVHSATDLSVPPAPTDTRSFKASKPIAIELPARGIDSIYTPLSARGDTRCGYFPHHENSPRSFRCHNLASHSRQRLSSTYSSTTMSSTSSPHHSPSEIAHLPLSMQNSSPAQPPPPFPGPDFFAPLGKYYPSNYKKPPSSGSSSPRNCSSPGHLSLSTSPMPSRPSVHRRRSVEVKQKLQQYQRQMVHQARLARENPTIVFRPCSDSSDTATSPKGPKLMPMTPAGMVDVGGITPLELGVGCNEYISVHRDVPKDAETVSL